MLIMAVLGPLGIFCLWPGRGYLWYILPLTGPLYTNSQGNFQQANFPMASPRLVCIISRKLMFCHVLRVKFKIYFFNLPQMLDEKRMKGHKTEVKEKDRNGTMRYSRDWMDDSFLMRSSSKCISQHKYGLPGLHDHSDMTAARSPWLTTLDLLL